MELSILIVNYNACYFLEQCLYSVRAASKNLQVEVLVLDNCSTDQSLHYLRPRFPEYHFIPNEINEGFARGNNRLLGLARADSILFLNPDTLLTETVLEETLGFLNRSERAGALGVRMVDGSGKFLKESKRGFPGIWASFCKFSGLTSAFPRVSWLSHYYLGHRPNHKTQVVDALSGAYLMAKKPLLEKIGGFDPRFFMYAEDIDLCYRINKEGFDNIYYAEQSIVHFKGESSAKDEGYIRNFYGAMGLFVKKHYSPPLSWFMTQLVKFIIFIKLVFRPKKGKKRLEIEEKRPENTVFSVWGEKNETERLSAALTLNPAASHRIYCIGGRYTYNWLLQELEQLDPAVYPLVHAVGSDAVVGSPNSATPGRVIPLSPIRK